MDEMVLTIRGKKHYLWRAVDQDGNVLDILVQSRRNKKAAKRFFRKLLKGATCWISWCRADATKKQRKDFSASCSKGIVNLFVEKKIIDELKRGKGVESNERLGILSC